MSQPVTQYLTCRHVLSTGKLCGAAALKNHIFCFHHQRDRQRRANLRAGLAAKFRHGDEDFNAEIVASLELPAPDDPEAALVCLSNTFLALAAGAIPEKRAALMIYNLQTINSTFYNLLKHRAAMAAQENNSAACNAERALTDPEPIANILSAHRQADYEFSEQKYANKLETQLLTADDADETDQHESASGFVVPSEAGAESRDLGVPHSQNQAPSTALGVTNQMDHAIAEAAFNADAARMQALDAGDLARPAEAPHSAQEVEQAATAMRSDDWEKYVQRLWLNGFINDAQREKLHARIFHADRNVRAAARFLALKYAPGKVREVLAHGNQPAVASSQNEQIA